MVKCLANWFTTSLQKKAMPAWHEFKDTVTLFHGTSGAYIDAMKSEGIKPPDKELMQYCQNIVNQYVVGQPELKNLPPEFWDKIRRDAIGIRTDIGSSITGAAIYLSPSFDTAKGYALVNADAGGEMATDVYRLIRIFCKNMNMQPPRPILKGSKPVVVEVEIPQQWMQTWRNLPQMKQDIDQFMIQNQNKQPMNVNSFEVRVTQTIPPQMIVNIHEVS